MRLFRTLAPCMSILLWIGVALTPTRLYAEAGIFRFHLNSAPVTLDWNLAHTSNETYIVMNLMEGLVDINADGKVLPALAEKWEISQDGKTYTFTLRSGVKWSDGKPLLASQFRDSWLRLLDAKTHATYASYLFDIEGAEDFHSGKTKDPKKVGIRTLSDQVLEVKLKHVVPYFIYVPTFWVTFPIRTDLIAKNPKGWTLPGRMVTLGPFTLSPKTTATQLVLTQNPKYYRANWKTDSVKEVQAQIITDDKKVRDSFYKGDLDVLLNATTADLLKSQDHKQEGGALHLEQFPYWATYYVGFNLRNSSMQNLDLRKALSIAFLSEREKIPAILQGGQIPAKSWLPGGVQASPEGENAPFSIADARSHLETARASFGKNFPPLNLTMEGFEGAAALGKHLRDSFKEKLGLTIEVEVPPAKEFQALLAKGAMEIFLKHWGADFPDAANFFDVFLSNAGTNSTGWKNPKYDELAKRGSSTLDLGVRKSAYEAAEKLLVETDSVIVPLFHRKITVIVRDQVKGFAISPLNYLFFKDIELK